MSENNTHPFVSFVLWIMSAMCYVYSSLTVEFIYTLAFRGLSLFSLVLIVIINLPKAIAQIKKWGQNKK